MVFGKAYQPLARCFVAPIGICESLGQNVAGMDVKKLPTGGFYQVEVRGSFGQGVEHAYEVHLSALGHNELLVKLYESSSLLGPYRHIFANGVALAAHLQIGGSFHANPLPGAIVDVHCYLGAFIAHFYLGDVDHVAVAVETCLHIPPNGVGSLCLCCQCEEHE